MNEEEKETTKEQSAAQALIENTEEIVDTAAEEEKAEPVSPVKEDPNDENKILRKYKIKDIVFLAIMAACMLVTGAIMPLVGNIPVFGIIQVCLGLQFSIFPVIGMMKVRKTGSLLFMSVCCGVVLIFMSTVMFVCILICAVITEALTVLAAFTPAAIPGLTIGCFLGNLGSPYGMVDILCGTAATLFAAVFSYLTRKIRLKGVPLVSLFFPVLFNALIVGAELAVFLPEGFTLYGYLVNAEILNIVG